MEVGLRKSNALPETLRCSPVGMFVESVGRYFEALICRM